MNLDVARADRPAARAAPIAGTSTACRGRAAFGTRSWRRRRGSTTRARTCSPSASVTSTPSLDGSIAVTRWPRTIVAPASFGPSAERRIEDGAIDHDRFGGRRRVVERVARRRDEPNGRQRIEDRLGRQVHRRDHVLGEHARAVHRRADALVLFEHGHRPAVGGQASSGRQAAGPAADDRDIAACVRTIIQACVARHALNLRAAMFPSAAQR